MALRDGLKSEKAKERYDRNFNSVETTFSQKELEERDQQIRNKAITEFAERLKDSLLHNYRHLLTVDTDGFEWLTTDAVDTHIDEIAAQMKEGAV